MVLVNLRLFGYKLYFLRIIEVSVFWWFVILLVMVKVMDLMIMCFYCMEFLCGFMFIGNNIWVIIGVVKDYGWLVGF